jgi:8-oxo-dGTP pyrophosphatase MutT (NUDIX family)
MIEQPELWDIYDSTGARTGRTTTRGTPLASGTYHLVAHIWLRDKSGRWLIQKRADTVEWKPGIWAATGGSAVAGEDSLTSALRETEEELGLRIDPSAMQLRGRLRRHDDFADIWLASIAAERIHDCRLQHEVAKVKWATGAEIRQMIVDGDFFDYGAEYFAVLGQLGE